MKKLLLRLADKPTPQFPERFLRTLDRYTRRPKHSDKTATVAGWTMVAWLRKRNDHWYETYAYEGIQAAIALNY